MNDNVKSILTEIEGDAPNRNAYASINGYLYQFDLTLYHLLIDGIAEDPIDGCREGQDGEFMVETIEDYVKTFTSNGRIQVRLGQIKYHSTYAGQSKYEEAVLWMYYGFLQFQRSAAAKGIADITDFRTILYHYDKSPGTKNIQNALEEALRKNVNSDEEKQLPVYKCILRFGDSEELKAQFYTKAQFLKTACSEDLVQRIKALLRNRYAAIDPGYDEEFLYAAAVCKLIDEGRQRNIITLSNFDSYFESKVVNVDPAFYKDKIIELIYHNLEWYYEQIEGIVGITAADVTLYHSICNSINDFIRDAFQNAAMRKSFLNSVISDSYPDYKCDTKEEYELFLKNRNLVRNFIAKLAKMMYSFRMENPTWDFRLEEWFTLDESHWRFTHPYEERAKRGVIIGDITADGNHSRAIGAIIRRFYEFPHRPYIWYFDQCDDIDGCTPRPYLVDPKNPNPISTPVRPEDQYCIECMECLERRKYINTDELNNIFKAECRRRGGLL
jgi:hypothetical protein